MDQQQQIHQALHIWATMFPIILLVWLLKIMLYIIPMWRIARRAGLSAPMALLAAIPLIGRMLTLYLLAFSDWRVTPLAELPYGAYPPVAYPPAYPPAPPMAYAPPAPPPTAPAEAAPPTHEPPSNEPPTTM